MNHQGEIPKKLENTSLNVNFLSGINCILLHWWKKLTLIDYFFNSYYRTFYFNIITKKIGTIVVDNQARWNDLKVGWDLYVLGTISPFPSSDWNRVKVDSRRKFGYIPTIPLCSAGSDGTYFFYFLFMLVSNSLRLFLNILFFSS
jgi:hypothetical protein